MKYAIPLSFSILSAATGLVALPAFAGPTYESASGGTFSFYGQFSPSYAYFDDGDDSQGKGADNAKSNSRVGFNITQPFDAFELNFKFETAIGFRATDSISQYYTPDGYHWNREKLRHVDLSLKTPNFGTFYIGQGSQASDGVGNIDNSGTTVAGDVAIGDVAGGYYLRRDDGVLSDITVGDAFNNYDGSRRGRIRYDSPAFYGVSLRTSWGRNILNSDDGDDYADIALHYEGEFGNGIQVEGGAGYSYRDRKDGRDDRKDAFASGWVTLPQGFNFGVAFGNRVDGGPGGSYWAVKGGYIANWTQWGSTAMSVNYYKSEDMVSKGDEGKSWGVEVVQNIERASLDLYAGYRHYEYDDDVTSYKDGKSYLIGARWKF
ncbi:porin [Paracoccus sp. (in: a-proteobacteria)]|uniref:porin n=1 Tax=Paracoccus sp. TaxID=267 RepID=UPI003A854D07